MSCATRPVAIHPSHRRGLPQRGAGRAAGITSALSAIFFSCSLQAFPHVVQPGESLASLSTRVYGDPKLEVLLAAANGLDAEGGVAPVPGMRLEIPAPTYHRVTQGETWPQIAQKTLGSDQRADVLARANGAVPWVPPEAGEEVLVPYVVAVVAGESDRVDLIAKRFWGDPNRAWELDVYNGRKGIATRRGELILVPLPRLTLTEQGKADAKVQGTASQGAAADGDGTVHAIQARAEADVTEMPTLLRTGKFVDVVVRATRGIASGLLTPRLEAPLQRALVEALVALDATEEAARACLRWRAVDPGARLDPVRTSPKVRAVCVPR